MHQKTSLEQTAKVFRKQYASQIEYSRRSNFLPREIWLNFKFTKDSCPIDMQVAQNHWIKKLWLFLLHLVLETLKNKCIMWPDITWNIEKLCTFTIWMAFLFINMTLHKSLWIEGGNEVAIWSLWKTSYLWKYICIWSSNS